MRRENTRLKRSYCYRGPAISTRRHYRLQMRFFLLIQRHPDYSGYRTRAQHVNIYYTRTAVSLLFAVRDGSIGLENRNRYVHYRARLYCIPCRAACIFAAHELVDVSRLTRATV